jgi:protein TonB
MSISERRYSDSGRSGTGLAITLGVHAGVAALALAGLGVIRAPSPAPAPIITKNIPDPVTAPPLPAPPPTTNLPITIDVPPPLIEPTVYPDTTGEPPVITGTISREPGLTGSATSDPPPPAGPTTSARFDKRYANAAQPPYPAAARRLGEEGTVVVHVRIGRDGRVLASTLAQSSGSPRLDAAALAHALARWRFTPALKDGVAVEEERDISVRFELSLAG